MKKLLVLVLALSLGSCAVHRTEVVRTKIKTEKTIHTQISIHNRLYAEAEFGQNKNTFFFRCVQFQGITIIKPIELTLFNTEKLYNALTTKDHKNGDIVDIATLDNKLIHIEYKRYMFKLYPIFDIVDKENDAVYHIFCLPKSQVDKLFDKGYIDTL